MIEKILCNPTADCETRELLTIIFKYRIQGAKVWLPDPIEVWKVGEILEDFKEGFLQIQLEKGEVNQL